MSWLQVMVKFGASQRRTDSVHIRRRQRLPKPVAADRRPGKP